MFYLGRKLENGPLDGKWSSAPMNISSATGTANLETSDPKSRASVIALALSKFQTGTRPHRFAVEIRVAPHPGGLTRKSQNNDKIL